jgi:secondary thiamine-phosphate synthase enzyme
MVNTDSISLSTHGAGDMHDITGPIRDCVMRSGLKSGTITVFTPSATSGLTTIEFEPGLKQDFPELMEKLIPSGKPYHHDNTWHDGNGFSHLRAAMIGPSISIPFVNGELTLGTWQQIVFLEFDNRGRDRKLVVQIIGD